MPKFAALSGDSSFCWSYDSFGNRTAQVASNQSISGGGSVACQTQSGASVTSSLASYTAGPNANTNRLTGTAQAPGGPAYDAAGDVTNDGVNQYLYNGDGQICAVRMTVNGTTIMTGYVYDANGNRVGKGSIASMSCNPAANGFAAAETYVLGQGGEQLTALDGGGNWLRTNLFGAGKLLATYDPKGLHVHLADPLGTRRVQTNAAGVP